MMSSNVVLLHRNNSCVVLKPAICEDLDLHVVIFFFYVYMVGACTSRITAPIIQILVLAITPGNTRLDTINSNAVNLIT